MFSFFKKILKPSAPPPAAEPSQPAVPPSPLPLPPALLPAAEPAPAAAKPFVEPPDAPLSVNPLDPTGFNEFPDGGLNTARALPGKSLIGSALVTPIDISKIPAIAPERERWFAKLTSGLKKTGSSISAVFTGTEVDDALFEDLESALLMADTGMKATTYLLDEVKRKVKESGVTNPQAVRNILTEALAQLLRPLEKALVIGEFQPTVIMVAGVNGAGKTTSIGKLTRHLANEGASVLLAAADTFRAAAREQLSIWADRNTVEIISQEGGDPAAVSYDAVTAGKARGKDVVLVDTAGRLPTQLHLMEELKKIKRVVQKADGTAPHEILLVIDGNTGQNALSQVKSFDEAIQLTGLIVTKLDGTAKGGVLAAIALWSRERAQDKPELKPVPVYFIGVGEKLEDLETFNAREFALALLS